MDDRQGDANDNDDLDSRGTSSHCCRSTTLRLEPVVEATARRFSSHSFARTIVDVRTRNAYIT